MFARQVRMLAGIALLAAALGLAAVATSGSAAALRSADDTFVKALADEGIRIDSPTDAIHQVHLVCAALNNGASPAELSAAMLQRGGLTKQQVAVFLSSAVDNYCPEYDALFQ